MQFITGSILITVLVFGLTAESTAFLKKCPRFRIKRNTIIRTHASLNNSAKYLGRITAMKSSTCYKTCCESKKGRCNLVMERLDNNQVTCFLFDCGSPSRCFFRAHPSYTNYAALEFLDPEVDDSMYSHKQRQKPNDEAEVHTPKVTTEKVHITTTSRPHHWNHNNGHKWQPEVKQSTEKSLHWYDEVTTHAPRPDVGHVVHDHSTTSNSGRDWLKEKLDRIPPHYSLTRKNTPHRATDKSYVSATQLPDVQWRAGEQKDNQYEGYNGSEDTFDRSHDVSSFRNKEHKKPVKTQEQYKPTNDKEPEEEDFPRRVFVDNNPDYPEEPRSHTMKTRSTTPPTTKVSTTKAVASQKPTSAKKTATESRFNNIVIKRFNIQENKAVIPLAVGLVLALLLLMGVVFRLKTSRRRRTKAFLTDDADYLINGMYL